MDPTLMLEARREQLSEARAQQRGQHTIAVLSCPAPTAVSAAKRKG